MARYSDGWIFFELLLCLTVCYLRCFFVSRNCVWDYEFWVKNRNGFNESEELWRKIRGCRDLVRISRWDEFNDIHISRAASIAHTLYWFRRIFLVFESWSVWITVLKQQAQCFNSSSNKFWAVRTRSTWINFMDRTKSLNEPANNKQTWKEVQTVDTLSLFPFADSTREENKRKTAKTNVMSMCLWNHAWNSFAMNKTDSRFFSNEYHNNYDLEPDRIAFSYVTAPSSVWTEEMSSIFEEVNRYH